MYLSEDRIDTAFFSYEPGSSDAMIHNDHLGTPHKMTDSTGAIVWSAYYKPFGEATITVSTITNNLRFPGQYYDAETGNYYNYFRDYDTALGRYKQADPIGQSGGLNPFAYSANNPSKLIDPLGLSHVIYDPRLGGIIVITDRIPLAPILEFPAANNTIRPNANPYEPGGNGPAPYGTFPMGAFIPHNDISYGIGSFPIILPIQPPYRDPRTGVALHSGRANSCNKSGKCGVNFPTEGCIRTTDDAINTLLYDPPTTITIWPSVSF